MKPGLILSRRHWQEMLDHVEQQLPLEACGLLAGTQDRVTDVILVQNNAQSPVRFVMDPYGQIRAFDWIESNGLELLGIFHSHPTGPATASATDIAEAAYDVVHLIWSREQTNWQLRGFWIENGRLVEASLQIVE
jgi:[CysO sulfur-carrier protein]-S-L-cysteine hydrolase